MIDRTVEQRLAELEDVRAIEALKWRYLRACDRKQPDIVQDCFIPDAVIDFEGFPLFTDRDSFVALYREHGCVPHIIDMHHGQNPIVEVDGDRATGWFDLFFFQIDTLAGRHTQLAVSYDDRFVRVDGRWRIARTTSRKVSTLIGETGPDGLVRVRVAGRSDLDGAAPPPR